jgi:hypothetical protein
MMSLKESRQIYKIDDFYYFTPIKDGKHLDFYVPYDFGPSDDDEYIILEKRHEFRPYVLAYDLYGNDKAWWTFVLLNRDILIDPIRDMREGTVLRVARPDRIFNEITG